MDRESTKASHECCLLALILLVSLPFFSSCENSSSAPPSPEITSISPTSGPQGITVSITGTGFSEVVSDNKVTFNGVLASIISASSSSIEATVPQQAQSGAVAVVVGGQTSVGPNFTVDELMPGITSLEPDSGVVGTEITITGMNFSTIASENIITFNGGVIAEIQESSETELVTQVPDGAKQGPIQVEVDNKKTFSPAFKVITTGTLEVIISTSTTNFNFQLDGYELVLDQLQTIKTDIIDSIYVSQLSEGIHNVELSDLIPNCMVVGNNPVNFQITPGDTTRVQFQVNCEEVLRQFIFMRTVSEPNLYSRDIDCCASPIQLTNDLYEKNYASISDDGDLVAYEADDGDDRSVFIVDANGASAPLNLSAGFGFGEQPDISPDGTQVAYFGSVNGPVGLVLATTDGSSQPFIIVSQVDGVPQKPKWSPDGTKIVYQSFVDGDVELFVLDLSNSVIIPITDNALFDNNASWSPDGSMITYVSDDGIYVANSDGTGMPINLTGSISSIDVEPEWSPDGSKILYYDIGGSDFDIFVINADDSGSPINLTDSRFNNDINPRWSPDGSQILFEGIDFDEDSEIYLMNADGSGLIKLTNNSIEETRPLWGGFR